MKKLLAAILALCMIIALCACGQTETPAATAVPSAEPTAEPTPEPTEEPEPEPELTEINLVAAQYSTGSEGWWAGFEEKFNEAHEDMLLTVEVVPWTDIYGAVRDRIDAGVAPDILNIDEPTMISYRDEGLLADMTPYISQELKDTMYESLLDAWEGENDTQYALPSYISVRNLYCNMDLLNAAGIKETPKTWKEFTNDCLTLLYNNNKQVPFGMDLSDDGGWSTFALFSWNNYGELYDDGEWELNSTENIEAAEQIKQLYTAGYCNKDCYTCTNYANIDSFLEGTTAMVIADESLLRQENLPGNVQIAEIPVSKLNTEALTDDESGHKTLAEGDCFTVFTNDDADQTARNEAIKAFFDAFYEESTYSSYCVMEGFLPATMNASDWLCTNAADYVDSEGNAGSNTFYGNFRYAGLICERYPATAGWEDVKYGIVEAMQQICDQSASAKDALDSLQSAAGGAAEEETAV